MSGPGSESDVRWCELCAQKGLKKRLQLFQINFEEAALLCQNEKCTYPIGKESVTIKPRKSSEMVVKKRMQSRQSKGRLPAPRQNTSTPKNPLSTSATVLKKLPASVLQKVLNQSAQLGQHSPVMQLFPNLQNNRNGTTTATPFTPQPSKTGVFTPYHMDSHGQSHDKPKAAIPKVTASSIDSNVQADRNVALGSRTCPDETSLDQGQSKKCDIVKSAPGTLSKNLDSVALFKPVASEVKSPCMNTQAIKRVTSKVQVEDSTERKSHPCKTSGIGVKDDTLQAASKFHHDNVKSAFQPYVSVNKPQVAPPDKIPVERTVDCSDSSSVCPDETRNKHLVVHDSSVQPGESEARGSSSSKRVNGNVFLQWKNQEALCWLDVILCLFVRNQHLQALVAASQSVDCVLRLLLKAHTQAMALIEHKRLKIGKESGTFFPVKSGGGDCTMTPSVVTSRANGSQLNPRRMLNFMQVDANQNSCDIKANCPVTTCDVNSKKINPASLPVDDNICDEGKSVPGDIPEARAVLHDVRERAWQALQPRLKCVKGKDDSPVFALPLLLAQNPAVEKQLTVHYGWLMVCTQCGYTHSDDKVSKTVPTFPNVGGDFSMEAPYFMRSCFKCYAPNQRLRMKYGRLPPTFFIHFVEGLPCSDYMGYDFSHDDRQYAVTGIIQYRNHPDHFVAWMRNPITNLWTECDDMKGPVCQETLCQPAFPASEVHIVMWERMEANSGYKKTVRIHRAPPQNGASLPHSCASNNKSITGISEESLYLPNSHAGDGLGKDDVGEKSAQNNNPTRGSANDRKATPSCHAEAVKTENGDMVAENGDMVAENAISLPLQTVTSKEGDSIKGVSEGINPTVSQKCSKSESVPSSAPTSTLSLEKRSETILCDLQATPSCAEVNKGVKEIRVCGTENGLLGLHPQSSIQTGDEKTGMIASARGDRNQETSHQKSATGTGQKNEHRVAGINVVPSVCHGMAGINVAPSPVSEGLNKDRKIDSDNKQGVESGAAVAGVVPSVGSSVAGINVAPSPASVGLNKEAKIDSDNKQGVQSGGPAAGVSVAQAARLALVKGHLRRRTMAMDARSLCSSSSRSSSRSSSPTSSTSSQGSLETSSASGVLRKNLALLRKLKRSGDAPPARNTPLSRKTLPPKKEVKTAAKPKPSTPAVKELVPEGGSYLAEVRSLLKKSAAPAAGSSRPKDTVFEGYKPKGVPQPQRQRTPQTLMSISPRKSVSFSVDQVLAAAEIGVRGKGLKRHVPSGAPVSANKKIKFVSVEACQPGIMKSPVKAVGNSTVRNVYVVPRKESTLETNPKSVISSNLPLNLPAELELQPMGTFVTCEEGGQVQLRLAGQDESVLDTSGTKDILDDLYKSLDVNPDSMPQILMPSSQDDELISQLMGDLN